MKDIRWYIPCVLYKLRGTVSDAALQYILYAGHLFNSFVEKKTLMFYNGAYKTKDCRRLV